MPFLINIVAGPSLSKKMLRRWCFLYSYPKFVITTFLTLGKLWKKYYYKKCGHISIANLITQHFILNFAKISVFQTEILVYVKSYRSKKPLRVVYSTLTTGLWRSLTYQNAHEDISPLILMTNSLNIYALLPENVSFLECF